jgi:glycosyltransferase involved in cell wall biosynthesis
VDGYAPSVHVLLNAGPWLPIPPPGYGGIEHVIATLVPELRARGVRVTLATVGESTIEVDEKLFLFERPMFGELGATYNMVAGIPHAHMHRVVAELRARDDIDLVHDHLEVVGASTLAAMGDDAPPVLHTLHWDVQKHRDFYATFDGGGRVHFVCVSQPQLDSAPPQLAGQVVRAIPLGVDVTAFQPAERKEGFLLALSRITPVKGTEIAARVCADAGLPLLLAGPVAGIDDPQELDARLADPGDPLRTYADARYWQEQVRPLVDGETVRWVGGVDAERRIRLLAGARAALFPVRWEEPGATAALEALACGTPVVAMRRGAYAAIVEHGRTGFLADDEAEFASYLRRVDELDPAACRRAAVDRFSAGRMAEDYLAVYQELLSGDRSRARPAARVGGAAGRR